MLFLITYLFFVLSLIVNGILLSYIKKYLTRKIISSNKTLSEINDNRKDFLKKNFELKFYNIKANQAIQHSKKISELNDKIKYLNKNIENSFNLLKSNTDSIRESVLNYFNNNI